MNKFPAFVALRAFEAAARLGSQRKAAQELCVDHTVISRHIRALEANLGVTLMTATPAGTVLTPLGQAYYQRVAQALEIIAAATARVREQGSYPTLHVACSPGFAVRWLTPRVSHFLETHPGLEIALRPTNRPPGMASGEADVDIRFTEQCEPGSRCEVLGRPRVFPVVSPQWLLRHPPITRVEDLLTATLVHEETHRHWRLWLTCAGLTIAESPHGPRYWSAALAIDAARMGQGIALANEFIVADELASGQLVEVLNTEVVIHPYLFMAREERWDEPIIADFRLWLTAAIARGSTAPPDAAAPHST